MPLDRAAALPIAPFHSARRLTAACLSALAIVGCGGGDPADVLPMSRGEQYQTGRDLDLAIDGAGAFVFLDDEGRRVFSRTARLSLDARGRLVNAEGWRLLGAGGDKPHAMTPVPALHEIVAAGSLPAPLRVETSLVIEAPISRGPLRPDDLSTYVDARATEVRDADGRRVALGFYFRKLSSTRWSVHLLPFNVPPSEDAIARPIAELDFASDAAGVVRLPQVTVDVPRAADGMGRATLPITGLQVDFSGVSTKRATVPGLPVGMHLVGMAVGTSGWVDFLRLRATDGFVGIRVSALGEISSVERHPAWEQDWTRLQGTVVLARAPSPDGSDPSCPTACAELRYGAPGSMGLGLVRAGWLESPAARPATPASSGLRRL